ncbi:Fe-S protein assembly co-chaperone HscB [Reyranella sp. CPCC 100927]|uniref:Fe-S protein assembly co-chaperone HscB n=1 Tax=Reyranella sp. CPCC 100927 TaxID=2599616 RepID=UPI0011B63C76|nr:Fe-S protein assembly co-chaperone HscB [Reyranella sp. CPCC 100927]TWT09726.1 Fe-S protein assembly co-chaperone HscB [Reyranella sp. CPCC 100927]
MTMSTAATTASETAVCWSCGTATADTTTFCAACGLVQPPGQSDHFARLAQPRSFDIDAAGLDRRYFELQRQLHPDRFARKTAREKAISQQQAAALNEAYETLKNPLRRARYLAQQRGVDLPGEGRTIDDPELLMEAMERREALAESTTVSAVQALESTAQEERAGLLQGLSAQFAANDKSGVRAAILRLAYLDKFTEEARARRFNLGASGQ